MAEPLHVCARMQDLGIWFEACIFLFLLGLPHRLLSQKQTAALAPSLVTQAASTGMWDGPTPRLLVITGECDPWAQPHLLLVKES